MDKMRKKLLSITLLVFLIVVPIINSVNNTSSNRYNTINNTKRNYLGINSDQNSDSSSNNSLFIDPAIQSLLNQTSSLNKTIDVIVTINSAYFYSIKQKLEGSVKYSVKTFYNEFSMLEISSKLSDVIELGKIVGITGIYLNKPIQTQIDQQNLQPILPKSASSATNDSNQFVNFTKIIDSDSIGKTLGLNKNVNGSGVVIAMLDSGIDLSGQIGGDLDFFYNSSLLNCLKIYGSVSFVPYEPFYYSDFRGSGTFHAGIAAGTGARNSTFIGVAPASYLLDVKVLDTFGITYYSFILSGLLWSLSHDADIICMPWSFPGYYADPISIAVNEMVDRGVIVVTAAGDDGPSYTSQVSPAQSLKAITVGAYNSLNNSIANFSSRSPTYDLRVGTDVVAPGVDIVGPRVTIVPDSKVTNLINYSIPDFDVNISSFGYYAQKYGTPINKYYTEVSGTGAAASIVAGACALLVSLFPQATPEMIKLSLMKTASLINSNDDPNSQGFGLINVTAAAIFLNQYLSQKYSLDFRVPQLSLYSGFVMNADFRNITAQSNKPANWDSYNLFGMMSTQAMMPALLVVNGTDMSKNMTTALHLPLNQFAISFNNTFLLFSQLTVLRELRNVESLDLINTGNNSQDYIRYAGILGWNNQLLISVVVESWCYTYNGMINPLTPNYTSRVPAYKFTFNFINIGKSNFENLTLYSFFKADMYANKFGTIDPDKILNSLNSSMNDAIEYDSQNQLIWASGSYNYTNIENGTMQYTVMGFNSTTQPLNNWEINSSSVLMNMYLNGDTYFTNASIPGADNLANSPNDCSFSQSWKIKNILGADSDANFSGILGVGVGNSSVNALNQMYNAFHLVITNVTTPAITDMALIYTKTDRMAALGENISSTVYLINQGTVPISNTQLWFLCNYTSGSSIFQVYSKLSTLTNWQPMQVLNFSTTYIPDKSGVYIIGWIVGGFTLSTINDDALGNNYEARTVIVFDYKALYSDLKNLVLILPNHFPIQPFIIKYPGDLAMLNITIFSPLQLGICSIKFSEFAGDIVKLNKTNWYCSGHYALIPLTIVVPMFYGRGTYLLNLNITTDSNGYSRIFPIAFSLSDPVGRIMFDGIHNIFIPSSNFTISNFTDIGFHLKTLYQERLNTLYGNFYDFHSDLSSIQPKGMAVNQIVSGYNISQIIQDQFSSISQISSEFNNSLLFQQIFRGQNFFQFSNNITTDTYTYDLIKFYDALVLANPSIPFSDSEIANFSRYLNLGGIIFVFADNNSLDALSSVNKILAMGGMYINSSQQDIGLQKIYSNSNWNSSLSKDVNSIEFRNPYHVDPLEGFQNSVHYLNGCKYIAYSSVGKGKIVAIGNVNMITQDLMPKANNSQFIQNLFNFMLNVRFNFTFSLSNSTIPHGKTAYLGMNLNNKDLLPYLNSDFLAVAGFVDQNDHNINPEIFGYSLPFFPLLMTNDSSFYTYYDSSWSKYASTVTMVVWLDSPYVVSEEVSFVIHIQGTYQPPPRDQYIVPKIAYPRYIDLLFLLLAIIAVLAIWGYSTTNWLSRHRYVPMTHANRDRIETALSSLKIVIKQIEGGISKKNIDELEKLRLTLQYQRDLKKINDDIDKIASELGEK